MCLDRLIFIIFVGIERRKKKSKHYHVCCSHVSMIFDHIIQMLFCGPVQLVPFWDRLKYCKKDESKHQIQKYSSERPKAKTKTTPY